MRMPSFPWIHSLAKDGQFWSRSFVDPHRFTLTHQRVPIILFFDWLRDVGSELLEIHPFRKFDAVLCRTLQDTSQSEYTWIGNVQDSRVREVSWLFTTEFVWLVAEKDAIQDHEISKVKKGKCYDACVLIFFLSLEARLWITTSQLSCLPNMLMAWLHFPFSRSFVGGCQKERENPIFWEFLFSFSFSFF